MKTIALLGLLILIISGCSSTKLIDQWENPDFPVYKANKVLIVGMTADSEQRRLFEDKLVHALERNKVLALRSIDFFESSFTDSDRSEADLDAIEDQLILYGFDAVLVSKITGYEEKVSLVHAYREYSQNLNNFRDYYFTNQYIYQEPADTSYKIYHSETVAFCLCEGEERELLWRGHIDIIDPTSAEGNITDYIRTLINALKANKAIITD